MSSCQQNARRPGWSYYSVLVLAFGLSSLACKPTGRGLEPITGIRKNTKVDNPALDGQVDPASVKAILVNVPEGESRITNLEIEVQGEGLTHYTFKIGPNLTTECELAYDYILQPIGKPIQMNIDHLPDGEIRLCVVGQHSSGIWQAYELATAAEWIKETGALGSPEKLTAIPAQEKVSLVWERPNDALGFLVVRSSLPIDWQPEAGKSYEVGEELAEAVHVAYSDTATSFIDTGLKDNSSYHYAVFSFDVEYRYSPASIISAIPSVEPFTWLRQEPGAYLRNAVVGGTRYDGSRSLYVCRMLHEEGGISYGYHTGKFIPAAPGDLTTGDCYYPFGETTVRARRDYELLVVTRGAFEDWFQWTPMTVDNQIPATAFKAGEAQNPSLEIYACRFVQDVEKNYFVPGKYAATFDGCQADTFSLRTEPAFQMLTRKAL